MKHIWLLIAVLVIGSSSVWGQNSLRTYRIFFVNKGISPFTKGSLLYNQTLASISERALQRRAKVLHKDSLISFSDAPIYQPYIEQLQKTGAKILLELRWKNYVVVEMDTNQANLLTFFKPDYIKDILRTSTRMTTLSCVNESPALPSVNDIIDANNCGEFKYGASWTQHKMLRTYELHSMGITGRNAIIGVLDNGFRWKAHNSTINANVLKEFDFIFQDSITANQPNDIGSQDGHGSPVFSTISGYEPDSLIGVAPFAGFMLAKTEDMRFEKRIEEDNYAAGLEWFERNGVDVTTSSLGYYSLDSAEAPYNFSYLNGRTTIVSQAVNHAVALGVTCVTAAGNSGGVANTIISPADADSVITVGAFSNDSLRVAGFTSKGPNADSSIRPHVAALGVGVRGSNFATLTATSGFTGTSFATPLIGGCIGLLHSAFPEIKPYEIRSIITSTASQANKPDNSVGYGCPNIMAAAEKYGIVISPYSTYPGTNNHQSIVLYIRSAYPITAVNLFVYDANNAKWISYPMQKTVVDHQYIGRVYSDVFSGTSLRFYVEVSDSLRTRRAPLAQQEYYTINRNDVTIPCGIKTVDLPTGITENYEYNSPQKIAIERSAGYVNLMLPFSENTIAINDALGNTVYQSTSAGSSLFVPLHTIANGLYTIVISSSGKQQNRKVLLVY